MLFKEFLDIPCGLRYMFDSLQLMSACGRARLLGSALMRERSAIEKSYDTLGKVYSQLYAKNDPLVAASLATLKHRLMCLRDISGTISRLEQGAVLDDVDLFEIKFLAMLNASVKESLEKLGLSFIVLPDLANIVRILDPDGQNIESFYLYDSYSKELRAVRGELKKLSGREGGATGADAHRGVTNPRELELIERERLLEREIREDLSTQLRGHADAILSSLDGMGDLDLLLAKALQIKTAGLCFPRISEDSVTEYKGMFHPHIVEIYKKSSSESGTHREFVPIDIRFSLEPVTIIGANMGGKTVVLKMLALNQLLFQFGFGIAASSAIIDIKEGVEVCIGDDQSELTGLSSFAVEIKGINRVLERAESGRRIIALVDEPARTTNPVEGKALVTALLNILRGKQLSVILTTHYNIKGDFFRRLRVNGLIEGVMDYRLRECSSGDIPHEAINVARSLNVNEAWIKEAEEVLNSEQGH